MKKYSIIPPPVHTPASRMLSLSSAHFLADLLGCMLPGFLPKALEHFHLSLNWGVVIIAFMGISSNLLQIPVAFLDRTNPRPRMLLTGILLAGSIVLLGVLPSSTPFFVLCLLMILVGTGNALVHPFGLRGIQHLSAFAPTVTTPAFMTGGFFGSAMGPFLGALLVGSFGLCGILWMILPVVLIFFSVLLSHVRLSVDDPAKGEKKEEKSSPENTPSCAWSFVSLMVIALFLNTGTTTFQSLIPTHIYRAGLPLAVGGLSAMLFGAGSTVGSLSMGYLAKKYGSTRFILAGLCLGGPVMALYLVFSAHLWALALAFLTGMCASATFPMLVVLARSAQGNLSLGGRMAWIVGGSWGFGGLLFLGIGQFTKVFTVAQVISVSCVCYFLAFLASLLLYRRLCQKS